MEPFSERLTKLSVIDGEPCITESLVSLSEKGSIFLRTHELTKPTIDCYSFSVEINLERKFSKSLELFIDNSNENTSFIVNGIVHFTLNKKLF